MDTLTWQEEELIDTIDMWLERAALALRVREPLAMQACLMMAEAYDAELHGYREAGAL